MSQLGDMSTGFDSSVVVAVRVGSYITVGIVAAIVVIFFVILYVYLKNLWASNRTIRLRSGLVFPASNPISFPPCGLGSAALEAFPVTVFHVSEEELECAVCLCKLSDGEKVRMLPQCNHGFHLECIDMWFESHTTCPLCRIRVEIKPTPDSITEGIPVSEAVFSSIESLVGVLPVNMNRGEDRIISDTGEPSSSSVLTSVKSGRHTEVADRGVLEYTNSDTRDDGDTNFSQQNNPDQRFETGNGDHGFFFCHPRRWKS